MTSTFKYLKTLCDEFDIDHMCYSGHAVYGKECFAVASEDGNAGDAVAEILHAAYQDSQPGELLERGLFEEMGGARVDSLGKGYVVYWPHITSEES